MGHLDLLGKTISNQRSAFSKSRIDNYEIYSEDIMEANPLEKE